MLFTQLQDKIKIHTVMLGFCIRNLRTQFWEILEVDVSVCSIVGRHRVGVEMIRFSGDAWATCHNTIERTQKERRIDVTVGMYHETAIYDYKSVIAC